MAKTIKCFRCETEKPETAYRLKNGRRQAYCRDCIERFRKEQFRAQAKVRRMCGVRRSDTLDKIGFKSYAEYLKSDLWSKVSAKVAKRRGDNRSCLMCGKSTDQLRHTRFHEKDLLGHKTKFIVPVCPVCQYDLEHSTESRTKALKQHNMLNRDRRCGAVAQRSATESA